MIVFGDPQRTESSRDFLTSLREEAANLAAFAPGIARVTAGTRLLVEAGELTQGLLDAAFALRGEDDWADREKACAALLLAAASLWESTQDEAGATAPFLQALEDLACLPLPDTVTVQVPEGYAFYALYPELYARAARQILAQDTAPWVVLGLRSIGTSLGAVVATAGKVGAPPLTLRPTGHPFQRVIRLTSSLERQLFAQGPETRFALVDEGPGLSGSSFGAVADWLEGHQIPPGHIHFFPGHAGDLGPQASERHRLRWQQKSRHVVAFETLLHPTNPHALSWFEDGVCPAELDLKDVAGGRWRAQHFSSEADWPPCHTLQERRKYLYRARGRIWLAKFAGLGRYGDSKWARARRLERLGLIPPIRDLRHGFLIGEWLTSARPYCLGMTVDRGALLETLTAYLNFLARECPARAAWGASPEQLFAMAHFNIQERLGPEMAAGFEPWRGHLSALARRHRPVLTDNKMHAWEWLLLPDGRWLKADALDHHQGHDCIGAQDLAWDLEGACVELELTETEQAILERTLSLPAAVPPPQVRRFYRECYLAFQMGYFTLAADTLAAPQPEEAVRLRAAAQRYAERLSRELIASLPS